MYVSEEKTDNSGCEEVSGKKGFLLQKCELRFHVFHCLYSTEDFLYIFVTVEKESISIKSNINQFFIFFTSKKLAIITQNDIVAPLIVKKWSVIIFAMEGKLEKMD